jgi:hypothetical protein
MNSLIKFDRIVLLNCAVAFCLTALPGAAWADNLIYNNGAPDQFGTYYADANSFFTMDASTFTLAAGSSTITDATWWGGCSPEGTCPAADFTLSFYTDVAGAPGALIQSYSVGGANQTLTGNSIGCVIGGCFDEYIYTASFGPLTLAPGTTDFFAVGNNTGEIDTWGQETANAFAPSGSHYQFGGGVWTPADSTLAFELSGPAVPEPTSILLLGTVFLGIGAAFRRKFRAHPPL